MNASEVIVGDFRNLFANTLGIGNNITAGGFVNGAFINPVMNTGNNGPFDFSPQGNIVPAFFSDGHGPMLIGAGGPPWTLTGQFGITLADHPLGNAGFPGDTVNVGQQVEVFKVVPEPSTLALVGIGILGLAGGCRRRA